MPWHTCILFLHLQFYLLQCSVIGDKATNSSCILCLPLFSAIDNSVLHFIIFLYCITVFSSVRWRHYIQNHSVWSCEEICVWATAWLQVCTHGEAPRSRLMQGPGLSRAVYGQMVQGEWSQVSRNGEAPRSRLMQRPGLSRAVYGQMVHGGMISGKQT